MKRSMIKSFIKNKKPIIVLLVTLILVVGVGLFFNTTENFYAKSLLESRSPKIESFQSDGSTKLQNVPQLPVKNIPQLPSPETSNKAENNESVVSNTCIIQGLQADLHHITSNFSGATFDFRKYKDPTNPTSDIVMIYQKPIRSGEHTHVLAINDTGNIVTQPEDEANPQQRWVLTKVPNSADIYEVVSNVSGTSKALNHDGHFLTVKPPNSTFPGTKWKVTLGEASKGLLACSPSLSHESVQPDTANVEDQYAKQLAELTALVKKNHQHYVEQTSEQTSSSVFGNGQPLRLKVNVLDDDETSLNLGNDSSVETFQDSSLNNTNNIVKLLNKYEKRTSNNNIPNPNIPKCKSVDLGEYTNARVGQCNCIVN
jgi:hypothetical protein